MKNRVGGSCLLSPTTICFARATAPRASTGLHLTGFVDQQEIELDGARFEVLRYRDRAHHEHRLDRLNRTPCLGEKSADRQLPPFLFDLPVDQPHLPHVRTARREPLEMGKGYLMSRHADSSLVKILEPLEDAFVRAAVEGPQLRMPSEQVTDQLLVIGDLKACDPLGRRCLSGMDVRRQLCQPFRFKRPAAELVSHPS